jgi:protein TonB
MGRVLGIVLAASLHVAFILFGGLLFPKNEEDEGTLQEVELVSEDVAADEKKEEEEETPDEPAEDELKTEAEEAPDVAEIMRNLELSAIDEPPALEAASLGAIEQALSGQAFGGDFADALSFASGGRIGGTGRADADQSLESAFSLAEIDQKPRAIFQSTPLYPSEMRHQKVEGVVTVIFIVDPSGKVSNPRVEQSTHPAFERPALDAVKQWKFEPAIKAGKRVNCKMRVPIRFQPS